jgi:hypothetical protein
MKYDPGLSSHICSNLSRYVSVYRKRSPGQKHPPYAGPGPGYLYAPSQNLRVCPEYERIKGTVGPFYLLQVKPAPNLAKE